MVLWSEEAVEEEESWREEEGSRSGDASVAEGLVRLRKRFQEQTPPKRGRATRSQKMQCEAKLERALKKSKRKIVAKGKKKGTQELKIYLFYPCRDSPKRGIAARSQKKQCESELERALKKSKRKVVAKGKKKVSEPVEVIEIEEMDLVLHDDDKAKEVEVVTPKEKKRKTSKKKSPSKTVDAEPSTLAKRTRYAMKSLKVQVVEEEESEEEEEEEEEETDEEHDKMVKFGKRTILKGRLLRDLEEE
uniref:ABC transporter F family member 4-like n=1 Tax=Nicotiana tabacum TaxID=4097 RepID=A0A1S4A5E8_TOBAC|nr:PREDICTED: ABC transporter F family member 4-like [Nicotiana tabacum]